MKQENPQSPIITKDSQGTKTTQPTNFSLNLKLQEPKKDCEGWNRPQDSNQQVTRAPSDAELVLLIQ